MRSRTRLAFAAIVLPLAAGCAGEPPPPPPAPVVVAPEPEPPPPPPLPFPQAMIPLDLAERLLADDPMALRMLTLRALSEAALVPPDDAIRRRAANIGALLPLTGGRHPSPALELPTPPVEAVLARIKRLDEGSTRGPASARAAERAFLLETLLPAEPGPGTPMAPHDKSQARKVLDRLERLEHAGLVTPEERIREKLAVEGLMATLPETLLPPPPPPKKKVASRPASGSGASARRMAGGVSGKLEVIPSPLEFEPPKIGADFTGQAGAHLLSMASADHGARAWEALKKQFSFELGSHSYAVERADLGSLGVTHRLIAGPMDAQAAERLCAALRAKGQACMPTPFPAK